MLAGVPNLAFAIGYTNISWTLKVDLVCEHFCRLLDHMDAHGHDAVVPVPTTRTMEPARCSTSPRATSGARCTSCPGRATARPGTWRWTTARTSRTCATARSTIPRAAVLRRRVAAPAPPALPRPPHEPGQRQGRRGHRCRVGHRARARAGPRPPLGATGPVRRGRGGPGGDRRAARALGAEVRRGASRRRRPRRRRSPTPTRSWRTSASCTRSTTTRGSPSRGRPRVRARRTTSASSASTSGASSTGRRRSCLTSIASGDGHVVNISSVNGYLAQPRVSHYCTSKFAVRGFTESLRAELRQAGHPVRVTVVHPGGIRTNIARTPCARRARGLDITAADEARRRYYGGEGAEDGPGRGGRDDHHGRGGRQVAGPRRLGRQGGRRAGTAPAVAAPAAATTAGVA